MYQQIARFVGVTALELIVTAMIAAAALVPSVLILAYEKAEPPAPVIPPTSDMTAIAHTQSLIKEVAPMLLSTSSPSSLIVQALSLRPKGVQVTHVSYAAGAPGTLIIVGTGGSRDAIQTYQAALQGTGRFDSISLPVDVLIGKQGGEFTMTLTGAF